MAISSTSFKKGHTINSGRKHTEEWKRQNAERMRGNTYGLGKKKTEEEKLQISLRQRGENHWAWKGGLSDENNKIRTSREYKSWRLEVFKRDGFKCVWCGTETNHGSGHRSNINADHIKPFALFPELRFDVENGRTLCVPCHKTTGTWGKSAKLMGNNQGQMGTPQPAGAVPGAQQALPAVPTL